LEIYENDKSINIINEKAIQPENTRLPEKFLESLIEKHSQKFKRKLYETYENSDVVKLLKEV
jgi:hypothetical protein